MVALVKIPRSRDVRAAWRGDGGEGVNKRGGGRESVTSSQIVCSLRIIKTWRSGVV